MRILLVEDDKLLGDGIRAGLAQAGFAVDWVEDGVAAHTALRNEPFAAVVLDLGLPRLSGMELLRRLRAAGDDVPVLILTARDRVADRVAGLDAGADDYLVKPFDLAELAPLAVAREVEVELAEGAPATVSGEPDLLFILMRNLIDNAVRFSNRGGVVRVAVEEGQGCVSFIVTDQGPGIPEEERARVWERFHRVLGTGENGSGLGLSIVRRIAELHGARTWLGPGEQGRGLRVRVEFPRG
jgi:signal transduction histidine kinase